MEFLVEDYDNYGFLIAFNEKDDFGVRESSINRWPNEDYDDYLQRVIDIAKSIIKKTPEYESADIYELLFDEDGYYEEDYFVTHVEGD